MADIAELGLYIDSSGVVRATKELKKLDTQSGKNDRSAKGLTKSFGGLKVAATALASSLVIKNFFETAASFESMSKSLEVVTGSAEKATMAMAGIREFAQNTPFQVEEITQAFIKLKALGIAPTEENLRSFGNTSAAMGKSLNQMIEAVADAATGEFERLKEFGIKARSEGDNVSFTFQGVTKTIGKNSEEITQYLEEIGQTQFAGAMSMQMDTLNGKVSNLGDAIDGLFVTIAEGGAGEAAKSFMDILINATENLTRAFSDAPPSVAFLDKEIEKLNTRIAENQRLAEEAKDNNFLESLYKGDAAGFMAAAEAARVQREELIALRTESAAAAAEGGLTEAGAEDPEVAAEKERAKLEAIAIAKEEARIDEIFRAQEHTEHLLDIEYDRKQRSLEILEEEANARKAVMSGMFNNLVSLMNSGSKKMFNIGKVSALAQGILNLRESVMSAYAAGSEVGGPIIGAAYAATAGLAQAANLAKIKSASFGGGGGAATVSSTTGGQPVTGQIQMDPPSAQEQPVMREVRITVESDGVHSDGMRKFAEDLSETIKDMGGVTSLVVS